VKVAQIVVGSLLIAIGGLWTLFFAILLLSVWDEPNVGGYVFIAAMIGVGIASVVYGAVLCGRGVGSSRPAVGGHIAQRAVGVVLIALGGLWALLSLITFAIYDGDTSAVTYAYFLGSAAVGFGVAFLGGFLRRRA
jgi:hypothetical protein